MRRGGKRGKVHVAVGLGGHTGGLQLREEECRMDRVPREKGRFYQSGQYVTAIRLSREIKGAPSGTDTLISVEMGLGFSKLNRREKVK